MNLDESMYKNLPKCFGVYTRRDCYEIAYQQMGTSIWNIFEKKRGPLSIICVAQMAIQIVNALENLHEQGYLHQDVKPDNFMVEGLIGTVNDVVERDFKITLSEDPNAGTIKLIDFGQARKYKDSAGQHLPPSVIREFSHKGCKLFMSPRQMKGF